MSSRTHIRPSALPPVTSRAAFLSPRAQLRQSAFSLVELVVVVVIIAVISAIALPRFNNSLARARAVAASQRLAADLALARDRAVRRAEAQSVVFSTSTSSYTIPNMPALDNRSLSNYAVNLGIDPYRVILSDVTLGGDSTIIFDGFGVPDSAGSITVRCGNFASIVTIDPVAGAIVASSP